MLFSSITFLYYFLPVTLLIYYAVPERWKNAVLFAASFLFYVWGEPKYGLLLLLSVFLGYLGGIRIELACEKKEKEEIGNEQAKECKKHKKHKHLEAKQEKYQINNLTLHLKQLEKEEQKNPKINRKKEIIKAKQK